MALRCGIVGLPNVGKSTLFNALSSNSVPAENFPFCTIDPHVGIVEVPDPRLQKLAEIFQPEKVTAATVEFTDIAGLVRGASQGEGLGNQFLGQIRQVSAIIHVVRCFENENIIHVEQTVDPVRDAELIETELLLADLETIRKRLEKTRKESKSGDKEIKRQLAVFERLESHCSQGKMARSFDVAEEESSWIDSLFLLTRKPILYVANVDDRDIQQTDWGPHAAALRSFAEKEGNLAIRLCGQLEEEIAQLPDDEKILFLEEYGLAEPGLHVLIRAAYQLLGLETFFTGGPKEVRAWTIRKGATAPEAAGEIHTDFQKGFIKAEVYSFDDLVRYGSEKALREAGKIALEGKDYIVRDGDCMYFKFNV
ncbi:MAG: redox-regulated ATPase YchF [Candidatus Neomarinimicrobiota bacterium]|nr:MAG: redox-regulated ATPase YchF [Candidatus Neomarinimicrobiota bacterium]